MTPSPSPPRKFAGPPDTPSARVGRALVLLIFGFVLFALGTHGLNLTLSLSALLVQQLGGGRLRFGNLHLALALFLVAVAVVLRVRQRFLQDKGLIRQGLAAPSAFQAPRDVTVSRFLTQFLPGLAHLQLKLSPHSSSSTSREALFLEVGLAPSLLSMASRSEDLGRVPLQAEQEMKERAAFVTLAHEEFHHLCFDAHTDASLRALCFVLVMSLVPVFALLLAAPLPGELNWVIQASALLWFPFLIWVLMWGLHGGSHLLEHLADNHACQRLRPPEVVSAPEPQPFGPFEQSSAPIFLDSRAHHPAPQKRLEFVHTLKAPGVGRIIFFQTLILLTLAADHGASRAVEHAEAISPAWEAVRAVLLAGASFSAFSFSALAGALAPLRHAAAAFGAGGLFLLALFAQGSQQDLSRNSPWLLLSLTPVLGQGCGRMLLRSRIVPWLRAGTAAAGLPTRVEQTQTAQLALLHALQGAVPAGAKPSRFQHLLDLSSTHGRFFDATIATALGFVLVVTLAAFVPHLESPLGMFLAAAEAVVLAIYFTRWPEQRSGIFLLWGTRMALLGLLLLAGAVFINFDLYVRSQGSNICPTNPARQQICIGQLLMNSKQLHPHLKPSGDWMLQRCEEAHLIPESVKQDSAPVLDALFVGIRCAFSTPGHIVGPLFLWGIVASFLFDTGLSALRWTAAWRRSRSTTGVRSKKRTREQS